MDSTLPYIREVSDGLAALEVRPGEHVVVSGTGRSAQLISDELEESWGVTVSPVSPEGTQVPEADVLVDVSGDVASWASAMSRVRRHGRVLLLIPTGVQILDFDFYDRVHRNSLTLLVRRLPSLG